jgi:hypothetical protein
MRSNRTLVNDEPNPRTREHQRRHFGGHRLRSHIAMAVHSIAFVEHYSLAGLFYHRNVHVFDLIVAHTLMESIGIFTSFVVIMSVLTLFGVVDPVRDPGLSLAAWRLDTLWCLFALIARESWGRAWRAS